MSAKATRTTLIHRAFVRGLRRPDGTDSHHPLKVHFALVRLKRALSAKGIAYWDERSHFVVVDVDGALRVAAELDRAA